MRGPGSGFGAGPSTMLTGFAASLAAPSRLRASYTPSRMRMSLTASL